MFVIGILNNFWGVGKYNISNLISQDLRYCMYALIGYFFADEKYFEKYVNFCSFIGKIGIIAGIIALSTYGFDLEKVLRGTRVGVWEFSYYCWWILGTVTLFLFSYALFTKKHLTLSIIVHSLYLVLGLLFLKRTPVVETAIIYICYVVLSRKKNRLLKSLVVLTFLLITIWYLSTQLSYFSALLTSLSARFDQNYYESSRMNEVDFFINNTSTISKVIGYGLGNEIFYFGEYKNAIHVGFFDALYKGGIFFIAYYVHLLSKIIKLLRFRITLTQRELCAITISILALVSLTFGMCFTYSMVILNFTPCFGIVLSVSKNIVSSDGNTKEY
jgi:hypothetical protein